MIINELLPGLNHVPESFRYANAYTLETEDGLVLFDPAVSPEKLINADGVYLLIATHGHADHVASISEWQKFNQPLFWAPDEDRELLKDANANVSIMFGQPTSYPDADCYLKNSDVMDLDSELKLHCIGTPGHTKGSMCYLIIHRDEPMALITGDTLFAESFGRVDLPSGNSTQMYRSLQLLHNLLKDMPDSLPVCPGHGATISAGKLLNSSVWNFAEIILGV